MMIDTLAALSGQDAAVALAILIATYAIGSIPWAFIIVRGVTGEDIWTHGSGNVGAMNVRRTTGSWKWFAVAMLLDALKGFAPVLAAFFIGAPGSTFPDLVSSLSPSALDSFGMTRLAMQAAVLGAVLGHNYSVWMALIRRRFARSGKGLATGGGALLAYDWRYFLAVLTVGLLTIAITRYMMAGQVTAAATLPVASLALGAPDIPFALLMGLLVYAAHHRRFVGLVRGQEPRLYVDDGMGPRG